MDNILLIDDIFFEICSHLPLSKIIQLEQLSKYHKSIIRKYHFIDSIVKLNYSNYKYVIDNYNFKKIDLSYTKITDKAVIEGKLSNCHSLNLSYIEITDKSVIEGKLSNCHALDLSWTNIIDKTIKILKNNGVNVIYDI